ncbi:MAG: hypothetical protein ACTSW4_04695 [Candidatus Ranarchaeia archaeon]
MDRGMQRIIFVLAVIWITAGMANMVFAQSADEFTNEDIQAYILVNGVNLAEAIASGDTIIVNTSEPVTIYFEFNITSPVDLILHNLSLTITYADQEIFNFPYDLGDIIAPSGYSGNVTTEVILDPYMDEFGLPVATGIFRVEWYLYYSRAGDATLRSIGTDSIYVELPGNPVTTVVGTVASLSTVAVGYSLASTTYSWISLLRSVSSIYGIQSKSRQIVSLPLLAIVSTVPFITGFFRRDGKKLKLLKDDFDKEVGDRIRTRAMEQWPGTRCPRCKRKWKKEREKCKCGLTVSDARRYYGDQIVELSHRAVALAGRTKGITVKKLQKKLKISKKKAQLLSGLLMAEEIFEVKGLKGPVIKLVGNGMSVAFLFVTWSQLFSIQAYGLVEILTLVSGGLSVALILSLALQIRTQRKLARERNAYYARRKDKDVPPKSEPSSTLTDTSVENTEFVVDREDTKIQQEKDSYQQLEPSTDTIDEGRQDAGTNPFPDQHEDSS